MLMIYVLSIYLMKFSYQHTQDVYLVRLNQYYRNTSLVFLQALRYIYIVQEAIHNL